MLNINRINKLQSLLIDNWLVFLIPIYLNLFIWKPFVPFFRNLLLIIILLTLLVYPFKKMLKLFRVQYLAFTILVIIYIMAAYFSNHIYRLNISEALNIVFIAYILGLMHRIVSMQMIELIAQLSLKGFYFTSLVFTILGLLKFLFLVYNGSDSVLNVNTSFSGDYNIFAINIILLLLLTIQNKIELLPSIKLKNIILFVGMISLILSGSRRGIGIAFFIMVCLFLISIAKFKWVYPRLIRLKLFWILGSVVMGIILIMVPLISIRSLDIYSTQVSSNPHKFKSNISHQFYRMTTLFGQTRNFDDFYTDFWSYNRLNIDNHYLSGYSWAKKSPSSVIPVHNEFPFYAEGFLVNADFDSEYWSNNAYAYANFASLNVERGKKYKASVYYYISDIFNVVSWAQVDLRGTILPNNGIVWKYIDFSQKGQWTKLILEFEAPENGYIQAFITCSKENAKNFKGTKGYILFSNPKLIEADESLRQFETIDISEKGSPMKWIDKMLFRHYMIKTLSDSNFNNIECTRRLLDLYRIDGSNENLRHQIVQRITNSTFVSNLDFYYKSQMVTKPNNSSNNLENDNLKEYVQLSDGFNIKYDDDLKGGRIERWKYAYFIWKNQYGLKQKLIGNGFDYLRQFGVKFHGDATRQDYPHNFMLSAMLYSGILGFMVCLVFMLLVVWFYFKHNLFMLVLYLAPLMFVSVSGNSIFTVPVFLLMSILPFYINYYHKMIKKNL